MKLQVGKSSLNGQVLIPGSKSHTIRAIAIAAMADGKSVIENPLISSDALSAVACYTALGAKIDTSDDSRWAIEGCGRNVTAPDSVIDVGNSGTTLRLAMASAALLKQGSVTLTGDDQIQSRPVQPLIDSLNALGGKASSVKSNGKAPVEISGPLIGGKTTLECVTSQYLSSLLLACPLAQNDTQIDVTLLNEPDYVQITLDWLGWQDIEFENQDMKKFIVKGNQRYSNFTKTIPADFSSATFFLCAAAIVPGSDVTIIGLDFSDSQPDKAVAQYLKDMNADITIADDFVRVKYSPNLKGIKIDMNKTPDALPAMAVAACFAKGTTKLVNVAQARVKETDRIDCMAKELEKLGLGVDQTPDSLIIEPRRIVPNKLNGHHDHRIVMALSLAGMVVGGCEIDTAEAISVTFPDFVDLMKSLGGKMELMR